MKKPQKRLQYRGKTVTLKLDGFDPDLPIVVVNLRNDDSLIINLIGIDPDAVDKESVMRKAHILTEDFGQLRLMASRIQNRFAITEREITVNGIVFQQAHFETSHDLVTAFIPKDPLAKPVEKDANAPVRAVADFTVDESAPTLYGTLLGRRFTHVRTTANDFRLLLGPMAYESAKHQ